MKMNFNSFFVLLLCIVTACVTSQVSLNKTNEVDKTNDTTLEPMNLPITENVNATNLSVSTLSGSLSGLIKDTNGTASILKAPEGCPDLGDGKNAVGSLIKCQCEGNHILVDGRCQNYEGYIVIDALVDYRYTKAVNLSDYDVIIKDVSCDPANARYKEFSRGQFHVRPRGDVVLKPSAGDLKGLRISNYCINHQLDESGELTWTLKTCIQVPAVPRCCPPGQAMKEGSCQTANSPDLLQPSISANSFDASIKWPNITNYLSPVTCTKHPLRTELLSYKQSHLVLFPTGVQMGWIPDDITKRRDYMECPEYCIDGVENPEGTIDYYVTFCFSDPHKYHKQVCGYGPCLRKCCKEGEVMNIDLFGCFPHENATFNPPTSDKLSHYSIIEGWPLCTPITQTDGTINIDIHGILSFEDMTVVPTDYCVDMFVSRNAQEQSALACLSKISLWQKVRPILFPICNAISLIFLAILFICHLLAPNLLKNGGVHQLCHSVALSIAYMSSFTVFVFRIYLGTNGCFIVAICMQFGYLTTFFWLNVMCFEIWRKIRQLKLFRTCKSYPSWIYMLYAWGIPLLICVITVFMQYVAPENVFGVIKPHIGVSRCWFNEDFEVLLYFYGPIAILFISNSILLILTYINYKHMLRSYKETHKCLKDLGTGITSVNPKSKSSMPSRQLTNHVNDYKQRLQLFVLMATCWVTEILSWKIEPLELWAPTDTLNSLQGLFIFIIFLLNRNKRKQLAETFPCVFILIRQIKIPQRVRESLSGSFGSISPMSSFMPKVSKKLSNSTVVSNISSCELSSTSSLDIGMTDSQMQRSVSMNETKGDIVVLSHMPVTVSKSDQRD